MWGDEPSDVCKNAHESKMPGSQISLLQGASLWWSRGVLKLDLRDRPLLERFVRHSRDTKGVAGYYRDGLFLYYFGVFSFCASLGLIWFMDWAIMWRGDSKRWDHPVTDGSSHGCKSTRRRGGASSLISPGYPFSLFLEIAASYDGRN